MPASASPSAATYSTSPSCRARASHHSGPRASSRAYVDPNAHGASCIARSRSSRSASASSARSRLTSTGRILAHVIARGTLFAAWTAVGAVATYGALHALTPYGVMILLAGRALCARGA
jgi:hypothetical protein